MDYFSENIAFRFDRKAIFHYTPLDLLPRLCVLKASKYTKYIVGFQPSLVAKSLTGQQSMGLKISR